MSRAALPHSSLPPPIIASILKTAEEMREAIARTPILAQAGAAAIAREQQKVDEATARMLHGNVEHVCVAMDMCGEVRRE